MFQQIFPVTNDQKKQIRIVVITNDMMDEAVRIAWDSYVDENAKWGRKNITMEFWNIDKLVDDVQKYLFEENLFGAEWQSLLRKALYFIEESDYRNYAVQCFHQTERCVVYSRRRFIVADMTEDGIDVSNKDGLVDDEKFVDAENYIADIQSQQMINM